MVATSPMPDPSQPLPERILQFGGGNFLRGFAGDLIHRANQAGLGAGRIVVVQSLSRDRGGVLAGQQGRCTVLIRGLLDGRVVDTLQPLSCYGRSLTAGDAGDWAQVLTLALDPGLRVVLSNTTEAGVAFAGEPMPEGLQAAPSFPGKLCQVLQARWSVLGTEAPPLAIIPCELLEDNGTVLRRAVLQAARAWNLPGDFQTWVTEGNAFVDTLVDRIVPGFPADEAAALFQRLGYEDRLLTVAEPYHLWVLRGPAWIRDLLPLERVGNVVWSDDLAPFRRRKVRVLNGAHTALALFGRLADLATVRGALEDPVVGGAIIRLLDTEVVPTLGGDDGYVATVLDRFRNPFLEHRLADIALNSTAKWRVRLLPILQDLTAAGRPAPVVLASLAALIATCQGGLVAVRDEAGILAAWSRHPAGTRAGLEALLAEPVLWGGDIRPWVPVAELARFLDVIHQRGLRALLQELP